MDIITNLSENDLYSVYLDMKDNCAMCRMAHKECYTKPSCKNCERAFFIHRLKIHFKDV